MHSRGVSFGGLHYCLFCIVVSECFVSYRAGRKEEESSQNIDNVCMSGGQGRIHQIGEEVHEEEEEEELVVVVER